MAVALDADAELTFHDFQFGNPHAAEFGFSHAEIAQAEGDVVVLGIEFGEQPCLSAAWVGQPDDGFEIDVSSSLRESAQLVAPFSSIAFFEASGISFMFFLPPLVLARTKPR